MEKPGAGAKGRDSETGTAENSHFDPFFFTFSLAMRKKKKNNREIAILDFKHGNCLAFAISKGLL